MKRAVRHRILVEKNKSKKRRAVGTRHFKTQTSLRTYGTPKLLNSFFTNITPLRG